MIKKNEGFTLIELVVAMAASVTVMAAAFTVLMFGTRVEAQTTDIISDRQSVTLQMANLDSLVQNSEISRVEILDDDWTLYSKGKDDKKDVEVMSYDADTQLLKCASGFEMSDIHATLELNDSNTLLKLTVKTDDGLEYSVSARCYMTIIQTTSNPTAVVLKDIQEQKKAVLGNATTTSDARYKFLLLLASQYGSSGEILSSGDDNENPLTFAQWYNPEWGSDTPWCACFVSWGIALANKLHCLEPLSEGEKLPIFASVGDGYDFFEKSTNSNVCLRTDNDPAAGDIIFFDWPETVENYDHVGVVLAVDNVNGIIYTIEGNSNNKVAMRLYSKDDPCIIGYGVLDWVENDVSSGS